MVQHNISVTTKTGLKMTNRMRLLWERCSDGYGVVDFDASLVDWERPDPQSWEVKPQPDLPAPMPMLLEKYGAALLYGGGNDFEPFKVIYPIGKRTVKFDPIKAAPSLYLEFANTPCSTEGVLEFVSEYGLLETKKGFETVDVWCAHIKRMHSAISKWEKVRKDSPAAFAKIYKRLCPCSDKGMSLSLQVGPSSTLKQFLEPESLLSAIWVQFAGAIEGATSFSPCQECSVWIDTVPGSNRPDKIYCSDACRMRAYRKRKASK